MHNIHKKAFTLIEMIVVIMMIWILMMATTMYLWWSDEKRKIIEAQWCMNTIWWQINNYIFYTLTSKNLKIDGDEISPNYYIVEFTWWSSDYCSSGDMYDKINLSYSTGDTPTNITTYQTINISNICSKDSKLRFYRSWTDTKYIIMNKWFLPKDINDRNIFYLLWTWADKKLLWDAIIWLCINDDCTSPKEIWKFVADARSQTISIRNCKYYDDTDPTKCKTREGCQVYSGIDTTVCERY